VNQHLLPLLSDFALGIKAVVLFQADSKEKHVKDLAVVLGTETATIILDDTISVWPEHKHNLMQVKIQLSVYMPTFLMYTFLLTLCT